MPDNKHNYEYNYDLGDVIDNAVQMGSKIGSSVLGSIADALEQAGDAMGMKQPDTFAAWKRRLERKWKNGGQSVGVVLTAVGWTFTGCFGITALVMGILTAVGAGPLGLTHDEFMAIPILFGVFTPVTLGFLFMAVAGMKRLTYFNRLRKLLRAANDWTCDLPALARKAQIKQEKPTTRSPGPWAMAICPTPPSATISVPCTWTIRSCRWRPSPLLRPGQPSRKRRCPMPSGSAARAWTF